MQPGIVEELRFPASGQTKPQQRELEPTTQVRT